MTSESFYWIDIRCYIHISNTQGAPDQANRAGRAAGTSGRNPDDLGGSGLITTVSDGTQSSAWEVLSKNSPLLGISLPPPLHKYSCLTEGKLENRRGRAVFCAMAQGQLCTLSKATLDTGAGNKLSRYSPPRVLSTRKSSS